MRGLAMDGRFVPRINNVADGNPGAGISHWTTSDPISLSVTSVTDTILPTYLRTVLVYDSSGTTTPNSAYIPTYAAPVGTYTLSMWVRRMSGSGAFQFLLLGLSSPSMPLSSTWQRVWVTWAASLANRPVGIRSNTAAGVIQVTGITYESGTRTGPYFDGSMPNAKWTGTPNASTSISNGWAGY